MENTITVPHGNPINDYNTVSISGKGGSDAIHYKLTCYPGEYCPGTAYITGDEDQDFLTADLSTATWLSGSGPNILARIYGYKYTGTPGSVRPLCSIDPRACSPRPSDNADFSDLSDDVIKVVDADNNNARAHLFGSNGNNVINVTAQSGTGNKYRSFFNAGEGSDTCLVDGVTMCDDAPYEFIGCTSDPDVCSGGPE